jgi:hypothetical protein
MDINYHYTLRDLKIMLEIETIDLSHSKQDESMGMDASFVGIVLGEMISP